MNTAIRSRILQLFPVGLAGCINAQKLTDIHQLSANGNQTWPDGQTFTTRSNAVNLVTVAIKAGLNSGRSLMAKPSSP